MPFLPNTKDINVPVFIPKNLLYYEWDAVLELCLLHKTNQCLQCNHHQCFVSFCIISSQKFVSKKHTHAQNSLYTYIKAHHDASCLITDATSQCYMQVVKTSLGHCEFQQHKPLFDKECSKSLDRRKQAKFWWLWNPS